jgi:hypothetical protein
MYEETGKNKNETFFKLKSVGYHHLRGLPSFRGVGFEPKGFRAMTAAAVLVQGSRARPKGLCAKGS